MKVYTTIDAWNKMSYWAALGGRKHREFTCFGRAIHEDGDFRVTDVYLVKQEGTSGGVDGDDEDINRLMMELFEKGIEPDEAFRCWIHSHPGTGPTATYLSGTDDENIARYLTGDFLISIVLDSKGDNPFCQIDIKNPRMSIRADLKVELPAMNAEVKKACEEEFEEKSSGRTWTSWTGKKDDDDRYPYQGGYYDGYYSGRYGGYRGGSYRGSGGKVTQLSKDDKTSGKVNGAVAKKKSKSGGAEKEDRDIIGRPSYDDLEGMTLFGINADEYDAWLEEIEKEEREAAVAHVVNDDTDKIQEIGIQEIDETIAPDWVVAMADKMACPVELLIDSVNIDEYDKYIDEVVFQVQCGYKSEDDAIEDLEMLGIDKSVATREIKTRVNA